MSGIEVRFDRTVNAAYIALCEIEPGGVDHMYACDPIEVGGMINLDFDVQGRLVGIEVLDARRMLPGAILPPNEDGLSGQS